MSLASKLILGTSLLGGVLIFIGWLLNRYAPKKAFLLPIMISGAALAISILSALKSELFPFRVRVVAGTVMFAGSKDFAVEPTGLNIPIIYSLSFLNEGYGHGVVEWIALKVKGGDGTKLYTPVTEIDLEKFLQGKRALNYENVRAGYAPFFLGSQEASVRSIVLAQEPRDAKYPFSEWKPGTYQFELWMKTTADERAQLVKSYQMEIRQKTLDDVLIRNWSIMIGVASEIKID